MAEQTNLPSIPPPNENNLVAFARAVKEALEVRLGRRGQGLDAMVTFRDLEKVQMVQSDGRGGVAGLKPPAVVGTVGGSYNPAADTTPPTAPQNVKASGAVRNVIIEWDGPPSTYRNHAYAEIWRSSANNLNDAAQIGQSGSTMYVDAVGEGQTRYYWVRFVSQANVTGPWHAAGDAGAQAVTALDVAYALGLLAGQIRETHLYQTLGARIDLIDGAGPGSVDARVAGVQAQINSINGELAAISQTPAYDAAETYAAGVLVTYNGGLYRALQATTGNLPTNAAYWEKVGDYASLGEAVAAHALQLTDHETRVTSAEGAITAEAEARTLLETQVGANTAAIQAEAQTRATETGALSTQITTVVANYQAADAATLTSAQGYADTAAAGAAGTALTTAQAAVQAEAAARASADGALAESITTVQTTVGGNTAAIQTQATSINGLSAQYTIKVQAGGISGGLGLAAESPDGTDGVIDFAIRANRFHIAPPDGMGDVKTALFTHYATPTTINGVEIPAGTYMDAAFMRTFVAQKGQIGELAVDDAAIDNLSAAKLTAGDGTIGGRLKSSNYVAGETGWIVRPDGTAEFAGATVRGTIYADTGWFKGQIIGGNATTYASGAGMWTGDDDDIWKFRLGSDGTYLRWDGSSLTLRGTLTIEDGAGNVLLSAGEGVPWGRISGAGRPEDGATVGATIGENLAGQITEANVSTFIANAAIGNAQIGNIIQSANYVAGKSGWHINKSGFAEFQDALFRGKVLGSIIEGSTIVASNLTRYTDAGDPFFTYYSSTLKSADTTVFVKTEGGNLDEINSLTGVLAWYPFDAGPSGVAEIDHFKSATIALQVSGYLMADAKLGRYDDEWGAYIYLTDEAGNILEEVFGHWYESGGLGTYTQNGLLVTPVYYSYEYNTSSDGYSPAYVTEVRGAAISGTLSKTWSAATWSGQRLRLKWKILTNRGGYSGTFAASSYFRLSAKNHELS